MTNSSYKYKHILPTYICVFIILLLQGCHIDTDYSGQTEKNRKDKFLDSTIKTDIYNVPIDSNQSYFPFIFFSYTTRTGIDSFVVNWYSKMLYALKEPILFNKKDNSQVFRFTWLRTFHKPIAIRIEKDSDNKINIYWKVCDGAGGYEPGKLIIDRKKEISEKEWKIFLDFVKLSNYWSLTTSDDKESGMDGSEWILEGSDMDHYHIITRWTPQKGSFYNCCYYLITLTELTFSTDELY